MAGGDKANILLVDDQPGKLLSYEAMLSGLGETLIPARSAREALGHLLSTDVAVVPIDVCMPELDGFDLASMMREPPRFQQTPIIFVSGVHLTELVGLHGGQVRGHSDGPGHGTEVVVRLLIQDDDGQMVVRQPAAGDAAAAPAIRPRRILIVDDNRDAADSMALALHHAGHEVTTAYDGAGGIERASIFGPDVVLLDLGMPGLKGFEMARRIREQPWGATLPLIALTGWGQEQDRRRTKEAGFDAHLTKPVSASELLKTLEAAMAAGDYRPRLSRM